MERSTKNVILAVVLTAMITLAGSWVSYAVSQENHEVRLLAFEEEQKQLKQMIDDFSKNTTRIQLNTQTLQTHSTQISTLIKDNQDMRTQNAKLITVVENLHTVAKDLTVAVIKLKETTDRLDERSKINNKE